MWSCCAADCPASAQVCLSTGLTFPLMDDKQHNFDPHPKDRPDKYSPITQAFPITITSREPITGLQFEAVDEDCVRPWLSGMAGQSPALASDAHVTWLLSVLQLIIWPQDNV